MAFGSSYREIQNIEGSERPGLHVHLQNSPKKMFALNG